MSELKQNQIDYQNFLRANKNLSFNKSMKEFRKFGGHIGSNSASQVYRNSENKIIHTKKVKELRPKREVKLKVKIQEIHAYDYQTDRLKLRSRYRNHFEKMLNDMQKFKIPLFNYYFAVAIQYNGDININIFGLQSFAEIRIIKQLIDNSERGTMNSEFNIYSVKKREYLYDLKEADFR